jgi:GWxTD domain-containing protein
MKNSVVCFLLMCSFLYSSCHLYQLERKLNPVYAEFLSKVRYIITKEERKIFLELPDQEKKKFIEEFWQRRDPDPFTEENEFKTEYFNRMERADELFRGEGVEGWQTDRGRIYILFGPPTERIIHPLGGDPSDRRQEIWYYRTFPVIFEDNLGNGSYKLAAINLDHLYQLNLAQADAKKTFAADEKLLDFELRVEKKHVETHKVEGAVIIEIPYTAIVFKSVDDRLMTTFDIQMELKDSSDQLIWDYRGSFDLEIKETELQEINKNHVFEIPFVLEQNLEKLRQGKNRFSILLRNQTGDEELKKVVEFIL